VVRIMRRDNRHVGARLRHAVNFCQHPKDIVHFFDDVHETNLREATVAKGKCFFPVAKDVRLPRSAHVDAERARKLFASAADVQDLRQPRHLITSKVNCINLPRMAKLK